MWVAFLILYVLDASSSDSSDDEHSLSSHDRSLSLNSSSSDEEQDERLPRVQQEADPVPPMMKLRLENMARNNAVIKSLFGNEKQITATAKLHNQKRRDFYVSDNDTHDSDIESSRRTRRKTTLRV